MSNLEEQIYRRALHVPVSTRLVFQAPPTSTDAPPGTLATVPENEVFNSFRSWVEDQLAELRSSIPIGHKDADGRFCKNIERLELQVSRLESIVQQSWNYAKVNARLPGYYTFHDKKKPELIPPREFLCVQSSFTH